MTFLWLSGGAKRANGVHRKLGDLRRIGNAERDAWLLCMRGALEETVADVQARQDVDAAMTKLADWMRNQAGNPHNALP
jgi:truncated hemoglobin YjbI